MIHPEHRRQGLGRALTGELAVAAGGHVLRLWAHGDLPAAAALARTAGFERFRALWQMRRSLGEPLDAPALPAGRALRTFVPGQDEDEWLKLNGRAFAKHPEQGGWTTVAPSAIPFRDGDPLPHELTCEEIGGIVRAFAGSARRVDTCWAPDPGLWCPTSAKRFRPTAC